MQKLRADKGIGINLRNLRRSHNFTQDALVGQLVTLGVDISRGVYSRYETGQLNIPISVLIGLHQIYGCSYDDFFKDLSLYK